MNSFRFFLAVLTALSLPVHVQAAPAKEKVSYPTRDCGAKGGGKAFAISGFRDYPPFSWVELDEEVYNLTKFKQYRYNGFILDPIKSALNDIHIVEIKDTIFDDYYQVQKAILRGKTDMAFISYYVDEAKSGADYVYPAYFGNPFVVVSRASKKIEVNDVSGLKGMKGVVRREEEIENLIAGVLPTDTKLEAVDGAETAFRKLLSGEADFMISSPYAVEAEARRFKIKDKIHVDTKVLRHVQYFAAFSKLSTCRKYKKLLAQQLGERLKDKAETERNLQKYIRIWADKFADEPPLQYTPPEGE